MTQDCATTRELFSDYYDGGLRPDERRLLEEHLRACGGCGEEYRHYTTSLGALREAEPVQTTRMFLANVRAAAAAHQDRRENLRKEASEAVTMVTPKADPSRAPREAAAETAELHVPVWAPWALAATTFVAFLLGWAVSGRRPAASDEARVAALVEERVRARTSAPAPLPPPPSAPVLPDPRRVLEERGLVEHEGRWIPKELRDAFAAGKVSLGGRLLTREEAAQELLREFPPPVPAVPVPAVSAPSEETLLVRLLERERLARTSSGGLVPEDWLRKWEEGWIQTGPGAWVSPAEFREAFLREHRLVEYRGHVMTREQAEGLQALRQIQAPAGAIAPNELTRALEGLEVGAPASYRGLTVWPILAARPAPDVRCVTLHEALFEDRLELLDAGGLLQVQARNGFDADVLLLAGEILSGGRCARVVAEDTLVRAGQTAKVPVYCAEPAAWRNADRFRKESGHHLAPPALRRALTAGAGQGPVWTSLARRLWKGATPSDLFRKHAEPLSELRAHFGGLPDREPLAIGMAVGWGESLEFFELFSDPQAFAARFDRILAGCAIDLLDRVREGRGEYPNSPPGVKRLLESAFLAPTEPAAEGYFIAGGDGVRTGRITVVQGILRHAILFCPGVAAGSDRKQGTQLPREKARKTLEEYDALVKAAGPSRREELLHEVGGLGLAEATTFLAKQLGQTDPSLRRAAIQELGLSGDARAVEPLLQALPRSRGETPVYAELVKALVRLGDERAADPLIRALDPADPEGTRTVLSMLPDLLKALRTREVLERSMARLVALFDAWDGSAKGDPLLDPVGKPGLASGAAGVLEAARTALKQLAGIEFTTGAGARKWWNDREVRERWLKERLAR